MENDKVFELLTKMYSEMNIRFDETGKDIKEMKNDISGMKKDINGLYIKIDGDINNKLKALEDGYKLNYELAIEIKNKVDENTKNIEDINISLSEMKEDINYIASKTIKNDSKINKITEQLKITRA